MYIFMTIFTSQSDSAKIPVFLLFMTISTGYSNMRILQRKVAQIMLVQSVGKKRKTFYTMTFGAIGRLPIFYELVFVVVGMAISTELKFQGISKFSFMAGFTVNSQMFIFKFVIGFAVIKAVDSFDYLKRLFSMTLTAILSKSVLMRIFMTV